MQDHPNAAIVRKGLQGMSTGDLESVNDLLDDDIVWHEIGRSEPRQGKAALMAADSSSDYEITATVHDVVANDEHAVALVDAHATRGGKTLDYRTAEIMHMRDGKAIERWAFSDDTARIVEFFK